MRVAMLGPVLFVLVASRSEGASSVFTPAVESAAGVGLACDVVNLNPPPGTIAVTINFRSATGAVINTGSATLSNGQDATVVGGGGVRYCEAVVDTNAHADNLRVGISRRNVGASTLEYLATVRGRRVGTSSAVLVSPVLFNGTTGDGFTCQVLNAGGSSQAVLLQLFDENGSEKQMLNVSSLGSLEVASLPDSPVGSATRYCQVTASSATNGNKLRIAHYMRSSGEIKATVEAE
jgi:hypothetical protein